MTLSGQQPKRIKFIFAWYDLWFGAYWDRKARHLYLMIPTAGVRIDFSRKELTMKTVCVGRDLGESVTDSDDPNRSSKPIIECQELAITTIADNPFCQRHKEDFERRVKKAYSPGYV